MKTCESSGKARRRCCLAALLLGVAAAGAAIAVPSAGAQAVTLDNATADGVAAADAEQVLRQALQSATWPGDMVRLADAYLQQFAHRPEAAEAVQIRRAAEITARLLRGGDVQLFRSAFAPPPALGLAQADLRQAALGDAAAALRLGQQLQGAAAARPLHVGWLQLAAELGNDQAAYELALHFRRQAQPLLASVYEQRAASLGYAALPSLDHARK